MQLRETIRLITRHGYVSGGSGYGGKQRGGRQNQRHQPY